MSGVIGASRYHEDYTAGQHLDHRRGHTVSNADNQMLSLLTGNTAATHFNSDSMKTYMDGAFSQPLLNACVALALAVGLSSQDMAEAAVADLGYDQFRMPNPIFEGDTLYAASEVLDTTRPSPREDAGVLDYRITCRKDDTVVLTVTRSVLIKKRAHWAEREGAGSTRVLDAAATLLSDPPASA